MARKASIKNLKKAADDTAARVSELEKQLEEAKAKQAEARNKVREREKEIMQEENNDLADKVRNFFGEDIIMDWLIYTGAVRLETNSKDNIAEKQAEQDL